MLILEWFTSKELYKLPVSVEKKSWRFPYFCKRYCQRKIGTFLWATLYIDKLKILHFLSKKSSKEHIRNRYSKFKKITFASCKDYTASHDFDRQFIKIKLPMHHWIEKLDLKYSWEPSGNRRFHWNFVCELVRSNNTREVTSSRYVNSYYCMLML